MSDINAILDRHGIKRCGDSSCIFGPRGGMMTNGGCRCGHDDPGAPSRPTRLSRQLAHAVTEQAAEIARLTAELAAVRAVPADVEAALDTWAQSEIFAAESEYEPRDSARADANRDILRATIARAISDATAARGTVCGLLAAARGGEIVEWRSSTGRGWWQLRVRIDGNGVECRTCADGWPWGGWRAGQLLAGDMPRSARLVPDAEADADPNQRGPLPKGG